MIRPYSEGTSVKWKWGGSTTTGEVKEVFTQEVTRIIKDTEVTRHASKDNPAYLILQEDDDQVLKSHSEVTKA